MGKLVSDGRRDGRDSEKHGTLVYSFDRNSIVADSIENVHLESICTLKDSRDRAEIEPLNDAVGSVLVISTFNSFASGDSSDRSVLDLSSVRSTKGEASWQNDSQSVDRWRRQLPPRRQRWWWCWWCWWWHARGFATPNLGSSCFLLLVLLAIAVLCGPVSAVPMPSPATDDRPTSPEDVLREDVFQEDDRPTRGTALAETELEIIRRSIARGLGLKKMPDASKANVSQIEYERAHREYLRKLQPSSNGHVSQRLHVFRATAYPANESSRVLKMSERGTYDPHCLFFSVKIPEEDNGSSVDHATLRLLLLDDRGDDYSGERSGTDILLYLRTFNARKLIVRKKVELPDSRWIELDSTVAVSSWLEAGLDNLGLELEFLRNDQPVRRSFSSPVLNVFTTNSASGESNTGRNKRSTPEEVMSLHKGRRTKCKGESKKCCRHELTVMFKDLKGFEFIVYPKTFDAGYCKGRCPPRYNPAHHHALLQSLLWKEDRKRVPKPCCAPSKLDQLMIVYFDENDSTQLKVSYWKNIQVLECACS